MSRAREISLSSTRNLARFPTIPYMDSNEIIQTMMDESGFTKADLSRALGKTPGYMAATLSRGSVPRLDTFVQMAEAMGYKVVLESPSANVRLPIDASQSNDRRTEPEGLHER